MKEHEGSTKTTAKDEKLHNSRLKRIQDRGRGGKEASERGEHGKTGQERQGRAFSRSRCIARETNRSQQKDGSARRRSQVPSDEAACATDHRAAVQEKMQPM